MSDVDRLLAEYVAEHRTGAAANPTEFLARVEGIERDELAALIDGYLSRAPRQRVDPAAARDPRAQRIVDELERSLGGRAGLWPALLPELRHRAGLKRAELVARLADRLGVVDHEPKVATYYHQMEQGLLPARGVSSRVLAAISEIVGEPVESLRQAGEALSPFAGEAQAAAAFTRLASTESPPEFASPGTPAADAEWDEVDDLFRGG